MSASRLGVCTSSGFVGAWRCSFVCWALFLEPKGRTYVHGVIDKGLGCPTRLPACLPHPCCAAFLLSDR